MSRQLGIVGAGSWGTAIAVLTAENVGETGRVVLLARQAEEAALINERRENARYLPGLSLPSAITVTAQAEALREAEAIFVVVPSKGVRETARQLRGVGLRPDCVLISCTKGIEHSTGLRMSEIIAQELPGHPVAALSGPNHAEEIGRRLPAAAVIGCADGRIAQQVQQLLTTRSFRPYTNDDIIGIEWGGAVKNVFALAGGVCEGLGLGDNAKAALLTRGLAEMIRLGTAMGGRPETFQGLSGMGDLIVTCFSQHSRNNKVGLALGRGESLSAIQARTTMVAEGVPNTESIYQTAQRVGARTPIIDTVYAILYQGVAPIDGLKALLGRELRSELD